MRLISEHISYLDQGGVSNALLASEKVNALCAEVKFKEAVLKAYS